MYNTDLPNRTELPSSKQLLRSTIIAIIIAAALLVTVVLPSEYGIDPTGIGRLLGLTQMGNIKMQLAAEAENHRTSSAIAPVQAASEPPQASAPEAHGASPAPAHTATNSNTAQKTDETIVTLKPGQGVEVKLEMSKDAKAKYEWTSAGGPVNHNLHTDTPNGSHSYRKGQGVERDSGEITAISDGYHGWFWRNRNDKDVTITLKTSGDYKSVKRM
jgi:hypothetical protein